MDQEIQNIKTKLDEQSAKIDKVFVSVEKTRKYFLIIMWVSIIAVVLPMIGLLYSVPKFIDSYSTALSEI